MFLQTVKTVYKFNVFQITRFKKVEWCSQNLTNEVRWEYSKLWLSILDKDKQGMKEHCDKLGVGDLYALFACMVSGRTWDSIESGLDKTKFTAREVSECQSHRYSFNLDFESTCLEKKGVVDCFGKSY